MTSVGLPSDEQCSESLFIVNYVTVKHSLLMPVLFKLECFKINYL